MIDASSANHLPFDQHIQFDPSEDFEQFIKRAPARWVVYLLADEHDQPIQLLCVKNLRYSLKRRLGGDETIGPTRRVNYRDLVRNVHWRRVDSAFEADWLYYEAAKNLFPQTYRGMTGFRPAWFIHVDPDAKFPRYQKTIQLDSPTGIYIGPIEDKHAAARLIELLEDSFDLCRYYNILIQAPNALACAYKEMGKCPAPCDGSISMEQYRRMIEWSSRVAIEPVDYIREQTHRMQQAAESLNFETAAKIKAYIAQLSELGKGPFRHARLLTDFQYVCFQHGTRAGIVKLFIITPSQILEPLTILNESFKPSEVMQTILESAAASQKTVNTPAPERIGIVAHHLFSPKAIQGAFLPLDQISERAIVTAYRTVQRQKIAEPTLDEGVSKELQAM